MPKIKDNAEEAAQNEMEMQLMQKMGETGPAPKAGIAADPQNDGSDGGNAAALMKMADQVVGTPSSQAFKALGLAAPSPSLQKLWDNGGPDEQMAILEALGSSAGMANDDDIANEVMDKFSDDGAAPDPQQELLDKMGVK